MKLAVLITSYNRKDKTLRCLKSLFNQTGLNESFQINVFLLDDNSTDGTNQAITENFPAVKIIQGTGSLFWAGGMRKAWTEAIDTGVAFDFFLLLNDDTILYESTITNLLHDYCSLENKEALLTASTTDPVLKNISYGGSKLIRQGFSQFTLLNPNHSHPQLCDLANANILLVPFSVYKIIGILSDKYTHGLADFDYSLRAIKNNIPTYLASHPGGTCENDHGNNWKSADTSTLRERVNYLYSPKGLAYHEYLFYIKKHFPNELPVAVIKLWAKTLFPYLWDKLKK